MIGWDVLCRQWGPDMATAHDKTQVLDAPEESVALNRAIGSSPDDPPKNDGSVSIILLHDIPVYSEKDRMIIRVKEITFRKPTGLDLLETGNPVVFNPLADPPSVEHKPTVMLNMMSRLSGIATASLTKLDPTDMVSCFWVLTPFFMPRADV